MKTAPCRVGDLVVMVQHMRNHDEQRLACIDDVFRSEPSFDGPGGWFIRFSPGYGAPAAYQSLLTTGTGSIFWSDEGPRPYGYQKITVIGRSINRTFDPPRLYKNPGYDLVNL